MNTDEQKSLAIKIAIMALSGVAGALHQNLGADSIAALATDLVDLAFLAVGVWMHWNMKKVPENATVVAPQGYQDPRYPR
jgi:putative Ca2+/H+ antiporter (TMEM165/GDT1 family)